MTDVDPLLGSIIGEKYRIVRYLAEGGMGKVYEAVHVVVMRRFALKFLHPALALRRDALARFKQEATAAGSLENEHIAAVIDFGITPSSSPYLVMEYLEGLDLGMLLESEGPLSIERACDLTMQACVGIEKAHARGIIHRDLKPSNLFVTRRGDGTDLLKVMDFGVAKLLESEANSTVTRTGSIIGTPAYMSPEQARGEVLIDHRADLHALGVILYELLSGRTPHPGDSSNAIIHHLATQRALPLVMEGREFPPALVALVERALALNPDDRFASADELAQELKRFAQTRVWPALISAEPAPRISSSPQMEATLLARSALGSTEPALTRDLSLGALRSFWRSRALLLGLGGAALATGLVVFLATRAQVPESSRGHARDSAAGSTEEAAVPAPIPAEAPAVPRTFAATDRAHGDLPADRSVSTEPSSAPSRPRKAAHQAPSSPATSASAPARAPVQEAAPVSPPAPAGAPAPARGGPAFDPQNPFD